MVVSEEDIKKTIEELESQTGFIDRFKAYNESVYNDFVRKATNEKRLGKLLKAGVAAARNNVIAAKSLFPIINAIYDYKIFKQYPKEAKWIDENMSLMSGPTLDAIKVAIKQLS